MTTGRTNEGRLLRHDSIIVGVQVTIQSITPEAWYQELDSSTGGQVNSIAMEHLQILWRILRDSNQEGHIHVPGPAELAAAVTATEAILAQTPIRFSDTLSATSSA